MSKLTIEISDEPVLVLVIPLARRPRPPSDRPTFTTHLVEDSFPTKGSRSVFPADSNVLRMPLRRAG